MNAASKFADAEIDGDGRVEKEKDSDGREGELNEYEEWRCDGGDGEAGADVPPSLCLTKATGDFRNIRLWTHPIMQRVGGGGKGGGGEGGTE